MDFDSYLEALASADPTPGGGSAATLVGALGAALCAMVARITLGSAKLAPVHEEAQAIAAEGDALRVRFLKQRATDESAFRAVVDAQALSREGDAAKESRRVALQAALTGAAEAPLETARLAAAGIALTVRAEALGNANLMSDVDCSRTFARAAFDASVTNVEVNHRYMTDAATVGQQRERLRELQTLVGEP